MTLHEKWEHINRRLRILDAADQEAREINDELEELLKNTLMN